MKKILKDYFSFNSRERVSILLLCFLIAFFWILPNWYPETKKKADPKDWKMPSIDSQKILVKETNKKIEEPPAELTIKFFEFDPNLLSVEGWKKLGLRDKTIQTIVHYRERGGRFREAGDLKKIWGLSIKEANQLIPYVVISKKEKLSLNQNFEKPKALPASIYINQATVSDLLLIPGFNKPLAARMIRFRDKIGGFQNLAQIRKTYGLSDSLFHLIAPVIVL